MQLLLLIFNLLCGMPAGHNSNMPLPDPCEAARAGAAVATLTAQDSIFVTALINIKNAYKADANEHCISLGKNAAGTILASAPARGSTSSGKVPYIPNAFADLHNHPNNLPPDAGDFYGLVNMVKNNPHYTTRFVITTNGTLYALLVTDTAALQTFLRRYPPQSPAFTGGPKGFSVAITDEAREMKYAQQCSDEMVLAFILDKYNTGVCLLKQNGRGVFNKIITTVSSSGNQLLYHAATCL